MTLAAEELQWNGNTHQPGDPVTLGKFAKLVQSDPARTKFVADPLGELSSVLRMECQTNEVRTEFIASLKAYIGDERWYCVEYYFGNGYNGELFVPDSDWTTCSQVHYAELADVLIGSPMTQMVPRQNGMCVGVLRTTPQTSKWGGNDIPFIPTPIGKKAFIVHHVIGGKLVEMWMSANTPPDITKPALATGTLIWPSDLYVYGIQVGIYHGGSVPAPTVLYLRNVGQAKTYARAAELAQWTIQPVPKSIDIPGAISDLDYALDELHLTDVYIKRHTTDYYKTHTGKAETYVKSAISKLS